MVRHPNTIILGMQGPSSAFYLPELDGLIFALGFDGTGVKVNRKLDEQSMNTIADTVDARYTSSPMSPVKLEVTSKTYSPETRIINLGVKATSLADALQGIFRINLAITENHVMGPQQHDPGCPGGDPYPFKHIPHYNVLRKIVLGVDGEGLISGLWARDNSISKNYSFKLDSTGWAAGNCNIVIYVDKKGDTLCHSEIQQAIVQSVTRPIGVNEILQKTSTVLNVFPNPSQGIMTIQIQVNKSGNARLSLSNIFGQEVRSIIDQSIVPGEQSFWFNTSGISPGVYYLILLTRNEKISQKIVIL
jgi:hypothetical protein